MTGQGHGEEAGHGAEAGLRAVRLQQDAAVDPGHRRTVNTLGYYGFCQPKYFLQAKNIFLLIRRNKSVSTIHV